MSLDDAVLFESKGKNRPVDSFWLCAINDKRHQWIATTSPIYGNQTREAINANFGSSRELEDAITYAKFGSDRLNVFHSANLFSMRSAIESLHCLYNIAERNRFAV